MLLGDSLNQIILNLISNAVKFTHKGTVLLSVKLLNEDKENVTIEFAVTDSGIGIPDKITSIFNVLNRLNAAQRILWNRIGAAIVKQLIEAQGGSISKSELSKGSTFSFTRLWKTNET
jgi:signal transduction histidine kinase